MKRLFTSEAVSEGHPDKVADRISDRLLDCHLAFDPHTHFGCETLVSTGLVVLAGEYRSGASIDIPAEVRDVIRRIGYDKPEYGFASPSVAVMNALHGQSRDIAMGVDKEEQGAGDQGIMFGYASNETPAFLPFPLYLSNLILEELAKFRREGTYIPYLRPDSKSQVTVETTIERQAVGINTVVVSTQHDDNIPVGQIEEDLMRYVFPAVIDKIPDGHCKELAEQLLRADYNLLVNPTGRFVTGGPDGDAGLTGRKIIADTYGGYAPHGGGAFSGKDPSKVDRSAAYAARYVAKNLVAAGIADEITIQLAYAIGVAKPVSIYVHAYGNHTALNGDGIAQIIADNFDFSPRAITERLCLDSPIYEETSCYGHFGHPSKQIQKRYKDRFGFTTLKTVTLFPWEKTDLVEDLSEAFRNHFL